MASSNRCIEIFLGHKDEVFSPQDFTLSTQKMFDSDLQYGLSLFGPFYLHALVVRLKFGCNSNILDGVI